MTRTLLLYRLTPIITSLVIMLAMTAFYLSKGTLAQDLRDRLGWIIYDLRLSSTLKNTQTTAEQLPVVIVDIDEYSLSQLGHWPWQRDTLVALNRRLVELGATVISYDVLFPEEQDQAIKQIQSLRSQKSATQLQQPLFDSITDALDGDKRFAASVSDNEVVLSMVFNNGDFSKGELTHPLAIGGAVQGDKQKVLIQQLPEAKGFISNTPRLSQAAHAIGFINAHPDTDGIMRRARLIQHHQGKLYPSLALATTMSFLLADDITLNSEMIGDRPSLSGIQLFDQTIPVNSQGEILIPYQGPAYTFSYISAADVLSGSTAADAIEGKVVLIGATAASLSDFRATPTNHLYPGVEAHANVITGILNQEFIDQPEWSHGINFVLIVAGGLALSLALPFLPPLAQLASVAVLLSGIIAFDYWLWIEHRFIIDSVVPILTILLIGVFNMAYGFIINSRDRLQLKAMFGQYVPPQLVDEMSKNPGEFAMDGQRKAMSVLFADIRNFTTISEELSASELKQWLNTYFTPITEIIFHNHGTIDKYVGDMVMAFWGAPLDDREHALHSVQAAQAMLVKTRELRDLFATQGKPEVAIGVGISSGHMNVGNMGSQYRRSYTVIGDRVNLGSRLEGLTKYYGVDIIVSEETRNEIGDRLAFRHLDRVRVKGRDKPVDIFEPIDQLQKQQSDESLHNYHQCLSQYFCGDFDSALKGFRNLHQEDPLHLYQLYVERCESLKQKTPANWQGVFTHTEK